MSQAKRSTAGAGGAVSQETPPLRVGQVVVVPVGGVDQDAVVVEDFGPLGADGEQLVRLMVLDGPIEYRVPASLVRIDEERTADVRRRMAQAAERALERASAEPED